MCVCVVCAVCVCVWVYVSVCTYIVCAVSVCGWVGEWVGVCVCVWRGVMDVSVLEGWGGALFVYVCMHGYESVLHVCVCVCVCVCLSCVCVLLMHSDNVCSAGHDWLLFHSAEH